MILDAQKIVKLRSRIWFQPKQLLKEKLLHTNCYLRIN